jgi:RHH-type rel operon transcriptional repressor/antitoxin RelB
MSRDIGAMAMSKQTAVRLPDELNQRLVNLSQQTGRTVAFYLREAISTHIDDLEDVYLAEQALITLRQGDDQVLDAAEFWHDLDY